MSLGYAVTDEDFDVFEPVENAEDTRIVQTLPASRPERVRPRCSDWLQHAVKQIEAIGALSPDWDGDGALQPKWGILISGFTLIESLACFPGIPKPHVNPTRNGGVQFEWESGSRYFEIEVVAPGAASYFFEDTSEGVEEEGKVSEGELLYQVVEYIRRVHALV